MLSMNMFTSTHRSDIMTNSDRHISFRLAEGCSAGVDVWLKLIFKSNSNDCSYHYNHFFPEKLEMFCDITSRCVTWILPSLPEPPTVNLLTMRTCGVGKRTAAEI